MPQEIEIKLKVDSHDAVRRQLLGRGAAPGGRFLELNRIYDNAQRDMLAGDRGLRIRECRDERNRLARASLTYKGPREPGPLKRREEIELCVDDPAAAALLLEALGFVEVVRFEKRRESWKAGDCTVDLDEVPHLGCFVEIEGPGEDGIRRIQNELDLEAAPVVRCSYIGLLVDYCRAHGLAPHDVHF